MVSALLIFCKSIDFPIQNSALPQDLLHFAPHSFCILKKCQRHRAETQTHSFLEKIRSTLKQKKLHPHHLKATVLQFFKPTNQYIFSFNSRTSNSSLDF